MASLSLNAIPEMCSVQIANDADTAGYTVENLLQDVLWGYHTIVLRKHWQQICQEYVYLKPQLQLINQFKACQFGTGEVDS